MAKPGERNARNDAIDLLRGIAILFVLMAHSAVPRTLLGLLPSPIDDICAHNIGYDGVAIFFVISGFLITTTILYRDGSLAEVNLREFYIRRIARIIPCLALALATAWLLFSLRVPGFVPEDRSLVRQGIYAAATFQYHAFFLKGAVPGMDALGSYWSLSIEEIFYLIFPMLCVVCVRTWLVALVLLAVIAQGPF